MFSRFRADQWGGVVVMAAAAVMFAGAVVANAVLILGGTSFGGTPEQMMAAIAAHPAAWRLADVLILAAIILTSLGLVPITLDFGGPGRYWAHTGLVTFAIAAVFGAIVRILGVYLGTGLAVEGTPRDDPVFRAISQLGGGLGEWFTILAFTAIALYGVAMLRPTQRSAVGWLFVGGAAVGLMLHFVGAGIPAFIFLETGALGLAALVLPRLAPANDR